MSQSTDGQICKGILFEESFDFPWRNEPWHGEEDKWWREINGYKPPFELYVNGTYIGGKKPAESVYFEHQFAWDKENPFPAKLVNYCSGDCPMYILAIHESCVDCRRGYPLIFNPQELTVSDEQDQKLIDFCRKYLSEAIEIHNKDPYNSERQIVLEPKWYLSSYWG